MDKYEYKETAAQAADGDTKAFARLYETIYREMYYTAFFSLKNDADAQEAVIDTIRSGFSAVGRLRSEQAFVSFMMKTLCTNIKHFFKQYAASGEPIEYDESALSPNESGIDVKQEFNRLDDTERVIAAMYAISSFTADEIAGFMGMTAGAVRKKLKKSMELFELD